MQYGLKVVAPKWFVDYFHYMHLINNVVKNVNLAVLVILMGLPQGSFFAFISCLYINDLIFRLLYVSSTIIAHDAFILISSPQLCYCDQNAQL